MGDTELVNGDLGSSDTSAAVRSSVESGEHSPSRSFTSGTVAHATGPVPSSGPRYPSKLLSLLESHDSFLYIPKEWLDQRIF